MPLGADDLRFFVRLVEAGSISETARRLHSSPPAVSRRLAALEARFGIRLVDRTSRRFTPTEEGRLLAERAARIVADMDDVETELGARRGEPGGLLRIGAPMEVGRRRIAPLLTAFQRLHPKVTSNSCCPMPGTIRCATSWTSRFAPRRPPIPAWSA